jgi:hypothetical protein
MSWRLGIKKCKEKRRSRISMRIETETLLCNGKKNVLWGAGEKGIEMLFSLATFGIRIDCFCDSDVKKQKQRLYNKQVIAPEKLLEEMQEYNLIIAVEKAAYIQEIISWLQEQSIKNYLTWQDIGKSAEPIRIHRNYIYSIILDSYDKKLVIYGDAKKQDIQALKQLLNLLDIEIAYFIDDIETEYEWMGSLVKPVYDVLYEKKDDFKIIVTSDKTKALNVLDDMGLILNRDYSIYDKYTKNIPRAYILDIQLGYNFYSEGKPDAMPGFTQIGEDNGYKIVLLGGSTTDGTLFPFKSWGELLYEKFKQNGYSVKIINGGCGGYSSSQELIKLIRDVIPMRPDIVIDYTGVNDLLRSVEGHPFVSLYQKELFDHISSQSRFKENDISLKLKMRQAEYTLGVEHNHPSWCQFTDNIRMMNRICCEFGIVYRAFLQPHLTLKRERFSTQEREVAENEERITEEYISKMDEFYTHARQLGEAYLEDITPLFDERGDVYFDRCHVT